MNKVIIILSILLLGCNKNLKNSFIEKYEKRQIFDNLLNCHSYFLNTVDLGDSKTTPYEYYIFFNDGTLFYDVGIRKNYINSTIFSIDSIYNKKNDFYNWGYYSLINDTIIINLSERPKITAFLKNDTLFVFDEYPSSTKPQIENLQFASVFYKKNNFIKIDSTNILMKK
jgi:hypothetical protein